MRWGIDIEKELKEEIKALNRRKSQREIIIFAEPILIICIIMFLFFFPETLIYGLYFILISYISYVTLLLTKYKRKTEIKINEMFAYYFYILGIQIERLDTTKPKSSCAPKRIIATVKYHVANCLDSPPTPVK